MVGQVIQADIVRHLVVKVISGPLLKAAGVAYPRDGLDAQVLCEEEVDQMIQALIPRQPAFFSMDGAECALYRCAQRSVLGQGAAKGRPKRRNIAQTTYLQHAGHPRLGISEQRRDGKEWVSTCK